MSITVSFEKIQVGMAMSANCSLQQAFMSSGWQHGGDVEGTQINSGPCSLCTSAEFESTLKEVSGLNSSVYLEEETSSAEL